MHLTPLINNVFRNEWWLFLLLLGSFCKVAAQQPTVVYPRITGHMGILHPFVTFSRDGNTVNFRDYYQVGFPTGISIWKSSRIGFSAEFIPVIKSEKGASKMSNFVFHPGILVALGKGWTFAGRAAFETSGRYGFTPIFNKVIKKNKNSNFYMSIPFPSRFGNELSPSLGTGIQFGIAF